MNGENYIKKSLITCSHYSVLYKVSINAFDMDWAFGRNAKTKKCMKNFDLRTSFPSGRQMGRWKNNIKTDADVIYCGNLSHNQFTQERIIVVYSQ
jgi:hypothetical protein